MRGFRLAAIGGKTGMSLGQRGFAGGVESWKRFGEEEKTLVIKPGFCCVC